jgi:predicted lipopolysaccharide heptosyltransferase III
MYKVVNKKKRIAVSIIDTIGRLFFWLPRSLIKHGPILPDKVKEILVIRTAYLGDVIMTLPILKPLKERFPGCKISFLVPSGIRGLIANHPYIDEVLTHDVFWFYPNSLKEYLAFIKKLKFRKFDLVIEARGDIRDILLLVMPLQVRYKVSYGVGGGSYLLTHEVPYTEYKHKVEYHLDIARFLGCAVGDTDYCMKPTREDTQSIQNLLAENGIDGPFVCVHPGGRLPLKRWPIERCAELYDWVSSSFRIPLVIVGSEEEMAIIGNITSRMNDKAVVLAGKINFKNLAGLLSKSELFICNDSGPMHLAASVGTPTVAVFGPSNSFETSPYGNRFIIIEKDVTCRKDCDEKKCRNKRYHACMRDIPVEDVFKATQEILCQNDKTYRQKEDGP